MKGRLAAFPVALAIVMTGAPVAARTDANGMRRS